MNKYQIEEETNQFLVNAPVGTSNIIRFMSIKILEKLEDILESIRKVSPNNETICHPQSEAKLQNICMTAKAFDDSIAPPKKRGRPRKDY